MTEETNSDGLGLKKSKSKLSSLIKVKEEGPVDTPVNIYYSKDNWVTNESIVLCIDENTTISQLIDLSICHLPSLGNANFDKTQNFYMMLFKKKKQIPKYDYPICNPDSLIKDFDKYNFCLMERKVEDNKTNENKNDTSNTKDDDKKKDNKSENENKDIQDKDKNKNSKTKNNNGKCIIF